MSNIPSETDNKFLKKILSGTILDPNFSAAQSIKNYHSKEENFGIISLAEELKAQSSQLNGGDLTRVESILLAQAHTLDSVFNEMLGRFRVNMGPHFEAAQKYMKMALKAQSQCRANLQVLAEMKSPRPYIQNNQAQYQQVNNGQINYAREEKQKASNELLEGSTYEAEWMDIRAAHEAVEAGKKMDPVE